METKDGTATFYAKDIIAWRNWLSAHHETEQSVWLIIYKKESNTTSIYYPEAVDEALCFGWIDNKPNKRDAASYYQFFSKRNSKSNWSRVNKDKIARLLAENRMSEAGLEMVRIAKATGTWNALNEVENLVVPDDLQQLFDQNKIAFDHWNNFPPSSRRGILEWILTAKRAATRQKRIEETVHLAAQNKRANHYR